MLLVTPDGQYYIFAERNKSEKDKKSDPTVEIEFPAGVPKDGDNNDPLTTGLNEVIEGFSGKFFDEDFQSRVSEKLFFQPYSGKWIIIFCLTLTRKSMKSSKNSLCF